MAVVHVGCVMVPMVGALEIEGATWIVKFIGVPIQPWKIGDTIKVEDIKLLVALTAVKEGIGDVIPEFVLNPIAALLFPLQENEVPVPKLGEVAVRIIWLILVPGQTSIFEMGVATGSGFIVIV